MVTDYDAIADKYPEIEAISIRYYLELPSLLAALGDLRGQTVLDLACGTGAYSRMFAEAGAEKVVGVDISNEMLEYARAAEAARPLGIEYHHSDVAELPDLGTFDLVAAVYLLHYSPTEAHIAKVCDRIAAHIRPGGRFVSAILNPDLDRSKLAYDQYGFTGRVEKGDTVDEVILELQMPPYMALHANCWSRAQYEQAMKAAGLTDIEWIPFHVSQAGIDKSGKEHWDYYLANPHATIVTARKPG
ncbi:MAG: methyltransferase domain-containing protein [bacterium]